MLHVPPYLLLYESRLAAAGSTRLAHGHSGVRHLPREIAFHLPGYGGN